MFTELQTARLHLKRLQNSDWEAVSFLRSDKKVNEFIQRPSAETKEKALEFIKRINSGIDHGTTYYWKITEKNSPKMMGSICLWNFSKEQPTAEIGYDLHPEFHGKGIMSEALQRVVSFGFDTLHLETIEAFTHRNNEASKRLLEKNGFLLVNGRKDEDNLENMIYELKKHHS